MNLPNKLTLGRIIAIPFFVFFLTYNLFDDPNISRIISAALFIAASITDFLDGYIARSRNLITDFGKFIDPLADKFMVLGSMLAILAWMFLRGQFTQGMVFVWVVLIILFRELAVTSLRLVVAGKKVKVDLAANMMGKLKTVSQMIGTVLIIIEPLIFKSNHVMSYVCMGVMSFTTIVSGWNYFMGYLPHIVSSDD